VITGMLVAALLQAVPVAPPAVPFAVGEEFDYTGKYHSPLFVNITVAHAQLKVEAIDTVRGVPSWRFRFVGDVAVLWFKNHTDLTSWTGVDDFISRRFKKIIDEGKYSRRDDFHIYPDSGFFRNNNDTTTTRTPSHPIDDVAFFYFIRTTPLTVGDSNKYDQYYDGPQNPVVVNVLRREACDLPDDQKAQCLVLNPVVEVPHGMLRKDADARIWITDDARRIPVQIQFNEPGGPVRLKISKIIEPPRPQ
jgi:hypothetical protein